MHFDPTHASWDLTVRSVSAELDDRPGVFVHGRRSRRIGFRRLDRDSPPRAGKHAEKGHELGVSGGLAALSLDAVSSVAYGPEAMMVVLVTAGVGALQYTVPVTIVIVREPRITTAQRTEISLGVLLGVMLLGLVLIIRSHHVVPRGGVTILAQVTAGAFGTGWPFYVSNLSVALVLGLAANTSFGGLPVLLGLLAKDHRMPHAFYLRSERPVYRIGIVALALAAGLLLIAVNAQTNSLIPLFTIGVFMGFTLSQIGLVRHEILHNQRARVLAAVLKARTNVIIATLPFHLHD